MIPLQPPPFRTPPLDAHGQLNEQWSRFFLSVMTLMNQLLLVVQSLGGAKPSLLMGDDSDQGEGWGMLPGPPGPQGPASVVLGPPGQDGQDADDVWAMWASLTGYIPYVGAVTDVNLGLHSLTVDSPTLFVDSVNHRVGTGTITPRAGDALTVSGNIGNLGFIAPPDAAGFFLASAAGTNRWLMRLANVESGANTGSDYSLSARADDGTSLIPNAIVITRATGYVSIPNKLTVDTPTFAVDSVNHRVGVGTISPSQKFHARGGNATGFLIDNDGSQYTEIDFANNGTIKGSWYWDNTNSFFNFGLASGVYKWVFSNGTIDIGARISKYQNVVTAGWGVPAIYAQGRLLAQTGAVASVATYTVGALDGSFSVSMNLLITAFTAGTVSGVITYTDESNTPRSLTLNFSSIAGVLNTVPGAAGAFEGVPLHIRCKASTVITATTTVSVFTGTYNVEAVIIQLA